MERLRSCLEAAGLRAVRTYVQSGNVVLDAGRVKAAKLESAIADAVRAEFGFDVPVIARTSDEWASVCEGNPFLRERGVDPARLHVTFLASAPAKPGLAKLAAAEAGPDRFAVGDRAIYLHCPDGYGRSKLANTALERWLAVGATTRNWKTVTTLRDMAERGS